MVYNLNQAERERLVERYLSGELNAPEEQEFFIQVAVDNNLRQTLKAYRIMEGAMRKDRDAVPPGHSDLRARVMGIWAIRNLGPSHYPSSAFGRNAAPSETLGGTLGHFIATLGMTKWIISVAAVSTIAVGLFVAGAFSTRTSPAVPAPRQDAPPAVAHSATNNLPAVAPAPESVTGRSEPQVVAGEGRVRVNSGRAVVASAEGVKAANRHDSSRPLDTSISASSAPINNAQQSIAPAQTSESAHPTLSTSDTIKLRVKMTLPKR